VRWLRFAVAFGDFSFNLVTRARVNETGELVGCVVNQNRTSTRIHLAGHNFIRLFACLLCRLVLFVDHLSF